MGNKMKHLIYISMLLFIGPVSFAQTAPIVNSELAYRCDGYSNYNIDEPDIRVEIWRTETRIDLKIQLPHQATTIIQVVPKTLPEDDFSFYATFLNKKESVEIKVNLDDMGAMSSLKYQNQMYDLTCG